MDAKKEACTIFPATYGITGFQGITGFAVLAGSFPPHVEVQRCPRGPVQVRFRYVSVPSAASGGRAPSYLKFSTFERYSGVGSCTRNGQRREVVASRISLGGHGGVLWLTASSCLHSLPPNKGQIAIFRLQSTPTVHPIISIELYHSY
jgi:hypothetical protein